MRLFSMYNPILRIMTITYLMILVTISNVTAHEAIPTIATVTVERDAVDLKVRFMSEAYLAGIDLSQFSFMNDSEQSGTYDRLRGPLALSLMAFSVDDIENDEIARYSVATISGAIVGSGPITVQFPKSLGEVVVRQEGVENPVTQLLNAGTVSEPIMAAGLDAAKSGWSTFVEYIPVGFDHIVPKGLDHILFVLGIFFLGAGWRALIWQISAFTLAHTVTLALGALEIVVISGSIVEPLIAASIVFVAVENLMTTSLNKWRPVIIFGFGLLHGLGFASVLGDFGLPEGQFIPALIGFNIGVEVGQLTVVGVAAIFLTLPFGRFKWYRRAIAMPASIFIALVGAYWFIERVFL
ncbi:MAG: HupE/UreJ family protein [Rhodobacteraceae bacterium]|nr:HupE/UreJ family protein [Paracoccaceae bacterium]